MSATANEDAELAQLCLETRNDPLKWVRLMFPWGLSGTELVHYNGPDTWQSEFLEMLGDRIRMDPFDGRTPTKPRQFAVASGHGVGKSAISAMLILYILSTRQDAIGMVTANTSVQLNTKTWAEVSKWRRLCAIGHWFSYSNSRGNMNMNYPARKDKWRVDAIPFDPRNTEAFAGLHAAHSSPFYIFDEASAIPASIWEVADGGKTDGEPFHFAFGNPTQPVGVFRELFDMEGWVTYHVDARKSGITNKDHLDSMVRKYGEDSDTVRVRVKGEFPLQGNDTVNGADDVREAMARPVVAGDHGRALVCGIDVSRGGLDSTVVTLRRGRDARTLPTWRYAASMTKNTERLATRIIADLLPFQPDIIAVDATGVGGPLADILRARSAPAVDVHFGSLALQDRLYINRGTELWFEMKDWLIAGGCIKSTIKKLEKELIARLYEINETSDKTKLVPKDRQPGGSPDFADALALTFAFPGILPRHTTWGNVLTFNSNPKPAQAYPVLPWEQPKRRAFS